MDLQLMAGVGNLSYQIYQDNKSNQMMKKGTYFFGKSNNHQIELLKALESYFNGIQNNCQQSDRIIQVYDVVQIESNDNSKLNLVVTKEYCEYSLQELISEGEYRIFSEQEILSIGKEMLESVKQLFDYMSCYHQNIKPQNFLVSGNQVKVQDFCQPFSSNMTVNSQNMIYYSPEKREGKGYDPEASDIFSIGLILLKIALSSTKTWKDYVNISIEQSKLQKFLAEATNSYPILGQLLAQQFLILNQDKRGNLQDIIKKFNSLQITTLLPQLKRNKLEENQESKDKGSEGVVNLKSKLCEICTQVPDKIQKEANLLVTYGEYIQEKEYESPVINKKGRKKKILINFIFSIRKQIYKLPEKFFQRYKIIGSLKCGIRTWIELILDLSRNELKCLKIYEVRPVRAVNFQTHRINYEEQIEHHHVIRIYEEYDFVVKSKYCDFNYLSKVIEIGESNLEDYISYRLEQNERFTDIEVVNYYFVLVKTLLDIKETYKLHHGEINIRNIMVAQGTVKFSDFGSRTLNPYDAHNDKCMSSIILYYFKQQMDQINFNKEDVEWSQDDYQFVDIYALTICICMAASFMTERQFLGFSKNEQKLQNIFNEIPNKQLVAIFSQIFDINEKNRYNLQTLCEALLILKKEVDQ